jgi:hypothetical protein
MKSSISITNTKVEIKYTNTFPKISNIEKTYKVDVISNSNKIYLYPKVLELKSSKIVLNTVIKKSIIQVLPVQQKIRLVTACRQGPPGAGRTGFNFIQENEPTEKVEGFSWYKPSIENCFIWTNGRWVRFVIEEMLGDNTERVVISGGYF